MYITVRLTDGEFWQSKHLLILFLDGICTKFRNLAILGIRLGNQRFLLKSTSGAHVLFFVLSLSRERDTERCDGELAE
jgi:hypothetical protein